MQSKHAYDQSCLLFTMRSVEQTRISKKWRKFEITAYPMNVIKSSKNKEIIIKRDINALSVLSLLTPSKQWVVLIMLLKVYFTNFNPLSARQIV